MDEHTVKRFDQELSELNSLVLQMGGLVQEQISHAMEAMRNEDLEASREVIARDHVVNFMDVQDQLALFYWMRFGAGIAVVLGALIFIYAILVPRREVVAPGERVPGAVPAE